MALQLLIDYRGCCREALYDVEYIRETAREVVDMIQARIVKESYHQFEPHGITYFAIISKSHISVHTWPEYGTVAVDLFSCDESIPDEVAQYMADRFRSESFKVEKITRTIQKCPNTDF